MHSQTLGSLLDPKARGRSSSVVSVTKGVILMRRLLALLVLVFSCAVLALPATALSYSVRQMEVATGYDPGTLSYNQHFFAATIGGEVEVLSDDGVWFRKGAQGFAPVSDFGSSGHQVLYYDTLGRPSIRQGEETTLVSEASSSSTITPVSDGDREAIFGGEQANTLLWAKSDGTSEIVSPFAFDLEEWGGDGTAVVGACYVGKTILTVGFDAHFGYRVVANGGVVLAQVADRDPGEGPTKIAYGGGKVWGLWSDGQKIVSWDWIDGALCNQETAYSGGVHGLLGADSEGVVFIDGSDNILHVSPTVPEPGSLVSLGGGMVGLLAFVRRRQK